MNLTSGIYSFLISAIVWSVLVPWEVMRILFGPGSWSELWERLGRNGAPQNVKGERLLIHAVSVGEVHAAAALLGYLVEQSPSLDIVLTVGNSDGRQAAQALKMRLPQINKISFLPWDRKPAVRRFLQRWQPDSVIVVETEIWPNLFLTCRELCIPLYIVNGRIYPNDVSRYRLIRAFLQQVLACAEWIGVQSAAEKTRFLQIGAKSEQIRIIGNLKFDAPIDTSGMISSWEENLGNAGPILVGGSTHPPEEKWLLICFTHIQKQFPKAKLVLAPRHTRRAASLENLGKKLGLRTALWSARGNPQDRDVLILDRIGLLVSFYRCAAVAIIGGSFANHGGHNLLEAAAQGCAIVIGPQAQHFQDIVEEFDRAGSLLWLKDRHQLLPALSQLLGDNTKRKEMGRRALSLFQSKRGVSRMYESLLSARRLTVRNAKDGMNCEY